MTRYVNVCARCGASAEVGERLPHKAGCDAWWREAMGWYDDIAASAGAPAQHEGNVHVCGNCGAQAWRGQVLTHQSWCRAMAERRDAYRWAAAIYDLPPELVEVGSTGQQHQEAGMGQPQQITVNVHSGDPLLALINKRTKRMEQAMTTITEAIAEFGDKLSGLEEDVQRVIAALENQELNPEAQAAVDSLKARFDTLNADLDEAVPPTATPGGDEESQPF
jgi:hypothetical protein